MIAEEFCVAEPIAIPPTNVILGLVPRTQVAAGFVATEKAFAAAYSAHFVTNPADGWVLGPMPEDDTVGRSVQKSAKRELVHTVPDITPPNIHMLTESLGWHHPWMLGA
jgi:hypothetical protein